MSSMILFRRIVSVFVLAATGAALVAAGGCSDAERGAGAADAALTETDVHAIRALAADYSKLALAGNLDAWVDLYHSDAVRMNPGAPPLEGREAIRQWVGEVNHTVRAHEMEPIEVEGTRELAYVRGTSRSTLGAVLDGQDVTMADEVSWLAVVRPDESGAWRFYRLIYNTDLAPAAADGG
jgi:uncharacterized protein (TIGR02246 family)